MILLKQMIVLFIIMILGFFLAKKEILNSETAKKISFIVVNICNPALILKSAMAKERVPEEMMLKTFGIAVLMYVILMILGTLMPYLLRRKECKAYSLMTVFANIGFMGYPLISAMYGAEAVLLATVFNLLYSLLIYGYGVMIISGEKFSFSNLRKLLNSGVIACIAGIIIYFLKIPFPDFIRDTIDMVSDLTAPLSMMVIGATFVGLSVKSLLGDVRLLIFTVLRLILFPLAFFPVLKQFVSDPVLLGVCLIMIATPVGSMTVMIAQQYGGDTQTTSKGVALTTLLSVATMPLLSMILM